MDTPTPPKPSAKGALTALKNPKVAIAFAAVVVGIVLYIRHKSSSVATVTPAADGSSTPVTDPGQFYPGSTQGAVGGGGVDTTGAYGGYDTPQEPDWLSNAPAWLTNPPDWVTGANGTEPAATNAANPVTLVPAGSSIYDSGTHTLVTAGGGPPNTTPKTTPPPASGNKGKTTAPTPQTNHSGNANQGLRFIVKVETIGKGKNAHRHTFHLYETKPGKGDFTKGHKVDMGPVK